MEWADELVERFDALAFDVQRGIAKSKFEPLTRRAVAALAACTRQKGGKLEVREDATGRLATEFENAPPDLLNVVTMLTGQNSHPFGVLLLLIWTYCEFTGGPLGYLRLPLPATEYLRGIPLYAFDKHTAVGRKAISELPKHSALLRSALATWVPTDRWSEVTLMAAFYADAAPVALRLSWHSDQLLEFVGLTADMVGAGCSREGMLAVLEAVKCELSVLNELRRVAVTRPVPSV